MAGCATHVTMSPMVASSLRTPPGPRGGFLLGSFREVISDQLAVLPRYAREHGDVVGMRFGPFRTVLVSHPNLIEEVLATRAKLFHKGVNEQMIRPAAGNGIFLSEDDFWKRQRRMVAPPMHKARIAGYAQTMVEVAERTADKFADGEVRDLYEDMTGVGLAIAAKTLFGVDVREAAGFATALTKVMASVKARIQNPVPIPDWAPTPTMLRLKRNQRRLDAILYDAIRERRASGASARDRDDLLSLLLAARDEDDGQGMSDRQLRDEAMTLFIAGFETSAINLAWALYLLARNPEIAEAARTEVRSVIGDRPATAEDVPKLGSIERVVNEALRLYPPGWILDRVAREDLDLGGFLIRKGRGVWIAPWIVHRDPRFWEQPDAFIPDRWKGDLQKKLPRFAYFPFGGGPRVCIGNAFAMMEVMLVLTTMLRRFRFEPVGDAPVPEPGFTLRPTGGVNLKVTRI
jgi:cytochrome P450